MEKITFTEDEAAKLAYIAVKLQLEKFLELIESGMSFDDAMEEVFKE